MDPELLVVDMNVYIALQTETIFFNLYLKCCLSSWFLFLFQVQHLLSAKRRFYNADLNRTTFTSESLTTLVYEELSNVLKARSLSYPQKPSSSQSLEQHSCFQALRIAQLLNPSLKIIVVYVIYEFTSLDIFVYFSCMV